MCTIRCANTYSNADCHPNVYSDSNAHPNTNGDYNSHANRDPKSNIYADPMHGEMYTHTETAPHSSTASIASMAASNKSMKPTAPITK